MNRWKLVPALLLAGMLTACAKVNVPPADPALTDALSSMDEIDDVQSDAATEPVSDTENGSETTAITTTTNVSTTTTTSTTADDDAETETETEKPSTEAWADAYARIIRMRDHKSEHVAAYYALIRLDPDKVPELVILDDMYMELYTFADGEAELLLEDAYKSNAADEQNVCYQPIVGKFASAFSTMGGGDGYTIFVYDKLDTLHVTRYTFNNIEDEGGEMPYNPIWDSADEFGVQNNGYHDVTLSDDWIHIGAEFEDIHDLGDPGPETLMSQWESILGSGEESED